MGEMDKETYGLTQRLVEQIFPHGRILETRPGYVLVDQEGWYAPQWYRVGDGYLTRELPD
jgi:hypothetical protein